MTNKSAYDQLKKYFASEEELRQRYEMIGELEPYGKWKLKRQCEIGF